jgi:NAD(P)-dependent dehydrogenase (short-subunit alcohol dehydrogenase family)
MSAVVITGASSGVGYATALTLARGGAHVVAIARRADRLERLAAEATDAEGTLIGLPLDLTDFDPVDLRDRIEALLGRVDVLVHNAGALVHRPFVELTDDDWQSMLDVNLLAPVRLTRALLPLMGGEPAGHIVNVSSMGGVQGSSKFPGLAAYSASKGALITLTECLAEELAARNVRVNCVALGAVATEMLAKAFPGYEAPVTPEQVGPMLAEFALRGHVVSNGKTLHWAVSTP